MGGPLPPIGELFRLTQRLRELLDPASSLPSGFAVAAGPVPPGPAADIRETEEDIVVEVEVPGCPPERLSLTLNGNVLVVQGEYLEPREPSAAFVRVERPRGRFSRAIALPAKVVMPPEAVLSRGVLTVRMRRATPATRRLVHIEEVL